jgi:hypothetical protein
MWFLRSIRGDAQDAAAKSGSQDEVEEQGSAVPQGGYNRSQSAESNWIDHWSTEDRAWQYVTEAKADPAKEVTYFKYLQIAKDGGLSEITGTKGEADNLWSPTRYISAFTAILFMFGNTAYVVYVDLSIMFGRRSVYGVDDYLISSTFISGINAALNWISGVFGSRRHNFFDTPAKLIASVELLLLMVLWVRVFWALGQMLSGSLGSCFPRLHRLRWYAAQNLFFNLVPMIGVYSSLLMLFPAAPKVFIQDMFTYLFYRETDSKSYYRDMAWLLVSRAVCFVIGFDSFLVKFREGATAFIVSTPDSNKTHFEFAYFIGAAALLNQILGVVQLNWMIRERLFRFVFAGEDGVMSSGEMVKKDTWNAQIAERLFNAYKNPIDKFVMLLTFSDDDFQRLTLHEHREKKTTDQDLTDVTTVAAL